MKIRVAKYSDINEIADIHVECWRETYTGMLVFDEKQFPTKTERISSWKRLLQQSSDFGNIEVRIAELDNIPCGFIAAGEQCSSKLRKLEFEGEISSIYVLRKFQRNGVGEGLMAAAARSLIDRGMQRVTVSVLAQNTAARRFYEHLGGIFVDSSIQLRSEQEIVEVIYGLNLEQVLATAERQKTVRGSAR